MKIVVIEDDPTLNKLLSLHLHSLGYSVASALGGVEGLRLALEDDVDLVLLDVMMPEMDGWEVCERVRQVSSVPIILLTAKILQQDVIRGLLCGADDYVRKPFNMQELDLRIEAVLRRSSAKRKQDGRIYDDGVLVVDEQAGLVTVNGHAIHLTPTEFRLLVCLAAHHGQVVPHEVLLTQAWGAEYSGDTAVLSVYIRYLRQKLERIPNCPRYIHTVWGMGYRLAPELAQPGQNEAVQ